MLDIAVTVKSFAKQMKLKAIPSQPINVQVRDQINISNVILKVLHKIIWNSNWWEVACT